MELIIATKKLSPEAKKCHYKLVVNNMHGDDDVNTKKTAFFSSESDVIPVIKTLREIDECVNGGRYDLAQPLIEELPDNLRDYDSTNPEEYCVPTLHNLTWIDNDGEERKVTIKG